jgi:hypothetical protein
MNQTIFFRVPALLAALFLALGLVSHAAEQSANTIGLLDDAYATVSQGKHDYRGHRVRAMAQIKLAVEALGGSISGKGKARESQMSSDLQLKAAVGLLQQAAPSLTGKPLKHVNHAIQQLVDALSNK